MLATFDKTREISEERQITPEQARHIVHRLLQSSIDDRIKVLIHASAWVFEVDEFRQQEETALKNGTYNSSLDEHRYTLSTLIASGEGVMMMAKKFGLMPDAPFRVDDLKATLESLYDTLRGEHRKCNSEQTRQELDKLFNGKE